MTSIDADDVPPLEDCAEIILKANQLRDTGRKEASERNKSSENTNSVQNPKDTIKIERNESSNTARKVFSSDKKTDFGGMRKGFLFGGSSKPKKSADQRDGNLPIISPKLTKEEALRIPEVQESMANSLGFNKEWMTDDLISKVSTNEKLSKWLMDPRSSHILAEFQSNPSAAMMKYRDNPEVSQFFSEFGQIMGTHFDKLADEKEKAEKRQRASTAVQEADIRPAVEAEADRVLQNPEVRDALMDPDVQRVIQAIKVDPQNGERIMRTADAKLRHNLGILLKSGVLGVHQA